MGFFDWFGRKRETPPPGGPTSPFDPNFVPPSAPRGLILDLESALRLAGARPQEEPEARPLVYMFQHYALREAAFENHPKLVQELDSKALPFRPLLHFIIKARMRCELAGALQPLPGDDDDNAMEAELDPFQTVVIERHRRGGFRVYVIHMPAPVAPTEAHFVAIVFRDNEPHVPGRASPSTRYLTLEKTHGDAGPLLCEWTREGKHSNYGGGPSATPESFLAAVVEKLGA